MKKYSIIPLAVVLAVLLSSCSTHLGLSKIFNSGSASSTKPAKATHAPSSGNSALASAGKNTITITSAGYQPSNLQVKVGATVVWKNSDSAPHTATSDTAGVFDSGKIYPGNKFKFTFKQAGTFTYHSAGETSFTGTIVVGP